MKKVKLYKALSIALFILAILAVVCGIAVTGSGILDLSNIVRVVCFCVAIILVILAWIYYKKSK